MVPRTFNSIIPQRQQNSIQFIANTYAVVHVLPPHFQPQLGRTIVEPSNSNLQVLSTALTRKEGISDSPSNRADAKELGARPCRSGGKEMGARPCHTGGWLVVEGRSLLRQEEGNGDGKYRSHHHRHRHCCKMPTDRDEDWKSHGGRVMDGPSNTRRTYVRSVDYYRTRVKRVAVKASEAEQRGVSVKQKRQMSVCLM